MCPGSNTMLAGRGPLRGGEYGGGGRGEAGTMLASNDARVGSHLTLALLLLGLHLLLSLRGTDDGGAYPFLWVVGLDGADGGVGG